MMPWKRYNPIGVEEKLAVNRVLDSGCLSSFIGAWCDDFYGGKEVQDFEREISEYFGVKHAITFNSLTSGLIAAVGAIGIEPGDEVIVSPWTMSATATAILVWGGIPVFADIEADYYGLDPTSVKKLITAKTKAIIVTDIFGHGAKLEELNAICVQNKLKMIEDVAQAPGVEYKGKYCGLWGDIGGFSLNYHKHIHTGEGGFCVTDNDDYALKMKMIRNHAESSVVNSPVSDLINMVGFNFRLGEIEAAIGREQLKKLPNLLKKNINKAYIINQILSDLNGIRVARIQSNSNHAFYVLPICIDGGQELRQRWVDSLVSKGVPGVFSGYVNVHRLPMYQQKVAYGRNYPWCFSESKQEYTVGICPVAEDYKDNRFVGLLISMYDLTDEQCKWIANTMRNSWLELQ